jgi:CheY-like chemotaxis protein
VINIRGSRVLIVEDEFILAQDLSRYFRGLGAVVLGPAPSIEAAEAKVDWADAAVLDVDLNGRLVFALADALVRRNVPFVFFTGRSDLAIPARFRHVGHLEKPVRWRSVFDALYLPPVEAAPEDVPANDVVALLPKLRLAALVMMGDPRAADRLVELTLEQAIVHSASRDRSCRLEAWLSNWLEDTHRFQGRALLQ